MFNLKSFLMAFTNIRRNFFIIPVWGNCQNLIFNKLHFCKEWKTWIMFGWSKIGWFIPIKYASENVDSLYITVPYDYHSFNPVHTSTPPPISACFLWKWGACIICFIHQTQIILFSCIECEQLQQ